MRKLFTFLVPMAIWMLLTASVFGQAPQKMSYQAVIRNTGGTLVTSTQIGMEINIRQGSTTGMVVYTETLTPTTNANGLVSIEIGGGAGFGTINWASDKYYIETKTAVVAPLTTYTITGVSQLLSVPYALHAKIADNGITNGTAAGEMQYWNGSTWITVSPGTTGQVLTFVNGKPVWKTTEGKTDVSNPTTGKIWMDRNLGASQVAISSNDTASYGDLYQWGRGIDGHQIRTSGTIAILSATDAPGHGDFITINSGNLDWRSPQNTNLWQGVSGNNNPCPSGYRLPTEAEWDAERTSWGSNNSAGAFGSPLKLPVAGYRFNTNGSLINVGYNGVYWSSTIVGNYSRYLNFFTSYADMYSDYRAYGFSVRCLKD